MGALSKLIVWIVVLGALAFVAAPYGAYYGLRSAAQSQDVAAVAELVDFPAVRQSLRPQLSDRPEAMRPAPGLLEDPIGAIRQSFENSRTPQPDVNAYLTPQAIAGLMLGEGRYASERSRPGAAVPVSESRIKPLPRPRYWGIDRARMAVRDEGGSETIFTFARKGIYRWQLVHVALPDGGTPTDDGEVRFGEEPSAQP